MRGIDITTRGAYRSDMTRMTDEMARRLFDRTTDEAIEARRCIRCRKPVSLDDLGAVDRCEFLISAVCPSCWDELFPDD